MSHGGDKSLMQLIEFAQMHDDKIHIIENMNGYIFNKRYLVQEKLTEGAYGLIYKGIDMKMPLQLTKGKNGEEMDPDMEKVLMNSNGSTIYQPVIIKFTQQIEVNDLECKALEDILAQAEANGKGDLMLRTMYKGSVVVLDKDFINSNLKQKKNIQATNYYEQNHWAYFIQE